MYKSCLHGYYEPWNVWKRLLKLITYSLIGAVFQILFYLFMLLLVG